MSALRWNWLVPFVGGCMYLAVAIVVLVVHAGLGGALVCFLIGAASMLEGLRYRRVSKRDEAEILAAAAADLQAEHERADK